MGLRVSTGILYSTAMDRIINGQKDLFEAQQGLLTGKKLNSPSDNPTTFTRVSNYKNMKRSMGQYQRNINNARSYLAHAESTLDTVVNHLTRAKELAIQGATGTLHTAGMNTIAEEINHIREQVLSLSNTVVPGGSGDGSRYIFSGYLSDTATFDSAGIYGGDSGTYQLEINTSEKVTIGLRGDEIFSTAVTGNVNIFDTLEDIYDYLVAGDTDGVASMLDDLDQARNQVSNTISKIGARQNRLDKTEERLETNLLSLESFISQDEDLDIAQGAADYTRAQNALEASISTTRMMFEILNSI